SKLRIVTIIAVHETGGTWRSLVDAFAAGHDTCGRADRVRWSIVTASIAGEAQGHLMCSGDLYCAKIWSSQKASCARFRMRIEFALSPRVAARICFSKTAKIPTRLILQLHRWTIRRH